MGSMAVALCVQDYKSLCPVVMICVTLVNRHTDSGMVSLYMLSQLI